jgi:hypothetical protein
MAKVEDMRNHVMEICGKHSIKVQWCRRLDQAIAFPYLFEVKIPRVRSVLSYAVALHEIGHIVARCQRGNYAPIISEKWAWIWASNNAITWTAAMANSALGSFETYERLPESGLTPRQIKLSRDER